MPDLPENIGVNVFRLAFRPSTKKGEFYIGVVCGTCKRPILILEAPKNKPPKDERDRVPIFGEGLLSIPCYSCPSDTLYKAGDLKYFRAEEDYESFKDLRVQPSGSPRQPLSRKYKNAKPTFGIGAIEQRPKAAKIIARCISYWTDVESKTAKLLAAMLKINTDPAVALYLSLKNARARRDALDAVAGTVLSESDERLYMAIMNYKSSVEKQRNDLAHGMIGVANVVESGIVWIDTTKHEQYSSYANVYGITKKAYNTMIGNCFVYELGDLETIAREIENVSDQISYFSGYISSDNPVFRANRYPQLCAEPHIQIELDRLDQKNDP